MNEQTQQEIYELAGYEPEVLKAQFCWSAFHIKDKEACKLAAFEWGRKPKDMAYAWEHLIDHARDYSRHELMSLILIAGAPKFERGILYEQWRDTTMSYENVRAAVDGLKKRKSKTVKEPKRCKKCGEPI